MCGQEKVKATILCSSRTAKREMSEEETAELNDSGNGWGGGGGGGGRKCNIIYSKNPKWKKVHL